MSESKLRLLTNADENGEVSTAVLVMFPSREGSTVLLLPLRGCFERNDDLMQRLQVVHLAK